MTFGDVGDFHLLGAGPKGCKASCNLWLFELTLAQPPRKTKPQEYPKAEVRLGPLPAEVAKGATGCSRHAKLSKKIIPGPSNKHQKRGVAPRFSNYREMSSKGSHG